MSQFATDSTPRLKPNRCFPGAVVLGDIRGTRKRCLGMAGELLTDARETSYVI